MTGCLNTVCRLLSDVVEQLSELGTGLLVGYEVHRFKLTWFAADLPARASMLSLQQVRGKVQCATCHSRH